MTPKLVPLPKDTTSKQYVNAVLKLENKVEKQLLKKEEKAQKVKNGGR